MERPHKILLVDDSFSVINELSSVLTSHSMEVVTASNGHEGFETLKADKNISFCISDLNMPKMDGLTMMEHIRRDLPDCDIPFVMLTTEFDHESKKKGKQLGIKGWVVKPFDGKRVVECIQKLSEHSGQ